MKRLFVTIAFGSLVACASLAGLDDSDTLPGSSSGSGSSGSGSSSGTGQINQDGLTITPKDLTLPAFKCNQSVESPPITLENTSDVDQDYEATLPANDVFTIKSGGKGTVAKHNTATIVLEAKSAKPATATAVQVAIKTKSGIANVSAKVDVQGVILKVAPDKPDFGLVKEDQESPPINAIFTNDGNVPITFSGFDGTADLANFTLPATVVVEANKSMTYPITMKGGAAGQTITALATAKISDLSVLCGAPAPALTLTGRRVSDDVIVSPVSADFGKASCNAPMSDNSTQTIKVSNFSTTAGATWTATLPPNPHFTVTPASGTLTSATPDAPKQDDIKIQVLNAGDEPMKVSETLTVHTVGAKTTDTKITLTLQVNGGLIQVTPTTLDDIANGSSKSASIKNVGNEAVCIKTSSTNGAFKPTNYGSVALFNFSTPLDVDFSAAAGSGHVTGTINIGPGDGFCFGGGFTLCKPAPSIAVSGNAP